MSKTIGVLTSGGDCPGLNAVLRGVVCTATNLQWKVIGFRDGYEGLLDPDLHMELTLQNTEGIMQRGGTVLGTTNRGHFVRKSGSGGPTAAGFDQFGGDGRRPELPMGRPFWRPAAKHAFALASQLAGCFGLAWIGELHRSNRECR